MLQCITQRSTRSGNCARASQVQYCPSTPTKQCSRAHPPPPGHPGVSLLCHCATNSALQVLASARTVHVGKDHAARGTARADTACTRMGCPPSLLLPPDLRGHSPQGVVWRACRSLQAGRQVLRADIVCPADRHTPVPVAAVVLLFPSAAQVLSWIHSVRCQPRLRRRQAAAPQVSHGRATVARYRVAHA